MNFKPTFKSYLTGFILSIMLTLTAYITVVNHFLCGCKLIWIILILAVIQLLVQLTFFLHLGVEPKPKWKLYTFLFVVLIIAIIVGGSLWIMSNLNYHMMSSPDLMNQYMNSQSGL